MIADSRDLPSKLVKSASERPEESSLKRALIAKMAVEGRVRRRVMQTGDTWRQDTGSDARTTNVDLYEKGQSGAGGRRRATCSVREAQGRSFAECSRRRRSPVLLLAGQEIYSENPWFSVALRDWIRNVPRTGRSSIQFGPLGGLDSRLVQYCSPKWHST